MNIPLGRQEYFEYFEDENLSLTQPARHRFRSGEAGGTWGKRGCFAMASLGRHAWVLEPAHLREAVAQELAATAEKYAEEPKPVYEEDSQRGTP